MFLALNFENISRIAITEKLNNTFLRPFWLLKNQYWVSANSQLTSPCASVSLTWRLR